MMLLLLMVAMLALPVVAYADDGVMANITTLNVVGYIGSALFIVAIVNGIKKVYKLSGQVLVPIALLLGVSLQLLVFYFGDNELFARVMLGIVYGGGASGLGVLRPPHQ